MPEPHVLITGATGLVGRAAMEHYARRGYRVTAVSRRAPFDTYGATHLSLDLDDERACAEAFGAMDDVTQIVFAALYEQPSLVSGWTDDEHVKKNGRMLRNVVEPITKASAGLRNIVLLQGPKAYGVHERRIPLGAREDRDEVRDIPNFYWEQEDYLRAKQVGSSWGWTVIRPSLVVGCAIGGAMNIVAALGVYAALLKDAGEPLHYPGGVTGASSATDTELMARAFEWAGQAESAQNQVFNVTNGDQYTMRSLWPVFAESFGMVVGDDVELRLAEAMPRRGADWDRLRERHQLAAPGLDAFTAQSFQFADFCLAPGNDQPRDPSLVSTVKIRQAGFGEAMYTDDMFRKWVARYQQLGLLPPR